MKKSTIWVALVLAAITLLLLNLLRLLEPARPVGGGDRPVVGALEKVLLVTPEREEEITAKIDTGADFSSLDLDLVQRLKIKIDTGNKKRIRTAEGWEDRNTVTVTYILNDRRLTTTATVESRAGLSTRMLIGKDDLQGFLVDPSRQFLTRPRPSLNR